ncbi:calcium and integrin-binding family member 2-like isoform X2 [Petromyzon marinus]|uniref:Calcium and integrin-binding family member 3-like isoform X1 n=1 Tax=Petromyzon marinus TaxID=7757 RepID=A0AAJ7SRW1_PETMA|nr:calcium and integrin-binding family member 3-like isoform X1 [Petromyzon marinus]
MGNKQTIFTEEQLDAYQDCSYFTRKEILRLHGRFMELVPHLVSKDSSGYCDITIPSQLIGTMPELKENPFRQRILEVFSEDGQGNMSFSDFVDMFSAFSETAPRELKVYYAFKIYGESRSRRHPENLHVCRRRPAWLPQNDAEKCRCGGGAEGDKRQAETSGISRPSKFDWPERERERNNVHPYVMLRSISL